MVNYYHRFSPHCAAKLTRLNTLLTAANEGQTGLSPKSNFDLRWTESANLAFIKSKQILANTTLLVHPNPSASLNITCDASGGGVLQQCVLQQCVDNVWQPLSFFSMKLSPAETRYSAFDRELLEVYATIRHFRHNLEGLKIFVNTDHKPFNISNEFNNRSAKLSIWPMLHKGPVTHTITHVQRTKNEEFLSVRCDSLGVRQNFDDLTRTPDERHSFFVCINRTFSACSKMSAFFHV